MPTKVQVVFYSMYGHIHKMAEAVAARAAFAYAAQLKRGRG